MKLIQEINKQASIIEEAKKMYAGWSGNKHEIVDYVWPIYKNILADLKKDFEIEFKETGPKKIKNSQISNNMIDIYFNSKDGKHEDDLKKAVSIISKHVGKKAKPNADDGAENYNWTDIPSDEHDTLLNLKTHNKTPSGPRDLVPNQYQMRWWLYGPTESARKTYG